MPGQVALDILEAGLVAAKKGIPSHEIVAKASERLHAGNQPSEVITALLALVLTKPQQKEKQKPAAKKKKK
jgi:hypothetical protein